MLAARVTLVQRLTLRLSGPLLDPCRGDEDRDCTRFVSPRSDRPRRPQRDLTNLVSDHPRSLSSSPCVPSDTARSVPFYRCSFKAVRVHVGGPVMSSHAAFERLTPTAGR
jgi:hypothetical protein